MYTSGLKYTFSKCCSHYLTSDRAAKEYTLFIESKKATRFFQDVCFFSLSVNWREIGEPDTTKSTMIPHPGKGGVDFLFMPFASAAVATIDSVGVIDMCSLLIFVAVSCIKLP